MFIVFGFILEVVKKSKEVYFSSYSAAVQAARLGAEEMGYVVDEDDWFREVTTGAGKPAVGQSHNIKSIGLSRDGKPQRKALHIQIYGMESGRYELNYYVA